MKHRVLLAAVLGLAILAAACGDSSAPPTTTGTSGTGGADIEIVAVDFEYDPTEWTVAAGPGITVELINDGTLEHNWDVLVAPIEDEDEFDEAMVLWEISAAAGSTVTGTIQPELAPGTYQIICTIPGHFSAGMIGELTVTG